MSRMRSIDKSKPTQIKAKLVFEFSFLGENQLVSVDPLTFHVDVTELK